MAKGLKGLAKGLKKVAKLNAFRDEYLAAKQALHPEMDLGDLYEKYMLDMNRAAAAAGLYE